MQNNPKSKTVSGANKHDSDVLLASNVSSFKQWLLTQGHKVAEPEPKHRETGILFWVDLPGCKPVSVQEGRGRNSRFAMTHCRLRPILKSYLTSPMSNAIRDVVRSKPPGPVQAVIGGKLQQPAPAANAEVPATLKALERDNASFLLCAADIDRALNIDSPIPVGAEVKHVFGVRVAAGVGYGLTVAAHMKVYDCDAPNTIDGKRRLVEVVDYPIHSDSTDIAQQAAELFGRASALPNAIILVDVAGMGLQFFKLLEAMRNPSVKRYGMLMGQQLRKRGEAVRYFNRRAECSVLAAQAIKSGNLKLRRSLSPHAGDYQAGLELLGSKMPYSFDELGRYRMASADDRASLPSPDLFETISLAFQTTELPLRVEKQSGYCAKVQEAPAVPLTPFLIDLRDDFAISCPLTMNTDETVAAFAIRRWEYAEAMIKARPTQSGD